MGRQESESEQAEIFPASFDQAIHLADFLPEGAIPSLGKPIKVSFQLDTKTIADITFLQMFSFGDPNIDNYDPSITAIARVSNRQPQDIEAKMIFSHNDDVTNEIMGVPRITGNDVVIFDMWQNLDDIEVNHDAFALTIKSRDFTRAVGSTDIVFSIQASESES